MRVDHAFRIAGGSGCVTHGGGFGFLECREGIALRRSGQKVFVRGGPVGQRLAAMTHHDHTLDAGMVFYLLIDRQQDVVHQEHAILSVVDDEGQFPGMQPEVQGMQHASGNGDTEVGFQVRVAVPHQGSHAISALQPGAIERTGQGSRPAVEIRVGVAVDGLIRKARHDLGAGKELAGPLQQGSQGQRELHHGSVHQVPLAGGQTRGSAPTLSFVGAGPRPRPSPA